MNRTVVTLVILGLMASLGANYILSERLKKAEEVNIQKEKEVRADAGKRKRDQIEEQERTIAELRTRLGIQRQKLNAIFQQLENAKSADKDVDIASPENNLNREQDLIADLRQRLAAAREQERSIASQQTSKSAQQQVDEDNLDQQISTEDAKLTSLLSRLADLKAQGNDVESKSQIRQLRPTMDAQKALVSQLRSQRKVLRDQWNSTKADSDRDLKEKLSEAKQIRVQLENQFNQEKTNLEQAKARYNGANQKANTTNQQVAKLEKEYSDLSLEVDRISASLVKEEKRLDSLRGRL
jgi:chromosome segregation ATPase